MKDMKGSITYSEENTKIPKKYQGYWAKDNSMWEGKYNCIIIEEDNLKVDVYTEAYGVFGIKYLNNGFILDGTSVYEENINRREIKATFSEDNSLNLTIYNATMNDYPSDEFVKLKPTVKNKCNGIY